MITRKHFLLGVILTYAFLIVTLMIKAIPVTIIFFPFFAPVASFFVLAYDEGSKWDKCNAILPISRTTTVVEKYVFLLLSVVSYIFIFCLCLLFMSDNDIINVIRLIPGLLFLELTAPLIAFPLAFKGKTKKAFTICIIANIIFLPIATKIIAKHENDYLIAIFTVLLFLCSLLLSIHFYKKREF